MDVERQLAGLLDSARNAFGDEEVARIEQAADLARDCHERQTRKLDDTPYVTHPIAVAHNCIDWGLTDPVAVMAALLHDAIEDAPPDKDAPRRIRALDRDVASLVRALSKIRNPSTGVGDMPATYQRILQAASQDLRVLLIKALDVLHNARTFHVHGEPKATRKAEIGLIYVGVMRRLGDAELADELGERILPYLLPRQTERARRQLERLQEQSQDVTEELPLELGDPAGLQSMDMELRRLAQYVYLGGTPGKAELVEVGWPVRRLRIQVTDDESAWRILGHVHRQLQVMPRHVRDYLNAPRVNGFRALTTRVLWRGIPVAILVERQKDHAGNRRGILAEWGVSGPDRDQYKGLLATIGDTDLRMSEVHAHVAQERIDVFTPRGDRKTLPLGSVVVDLAYLVHSQLGDHCVGANINGVRHDPKTKLADGDVVEILTQADARPRRSWLERVRTPRARSSIRKTLRKGGGPVRGVCRPGGTSHEFVLEDPTVPAMWWSTCCLPAPPAPLVGRVSRNGRWIVHRQGCSHATSHLWERGTWGEIQGPIGMRMVLHLRHRPGALSEVLEVTTTSRVNILSLNSQPRQHGPFLLEMAIGGRSPDVLGELLSSLASLEPVRSIRSYCWFLRDTVA